MLDDAGYPKSLYIRYLYPGSSGSIKVLQDWAGVDKQMVDGRVVRYAVGIFARDSEYAQAVMIRIETKPKQ